MSLKMKDLPIAVLKQLKLLIISYFPRMHLCVQKCQKIPILGH